MSNVFSGVDGLELRLTFKDQDGAAIDLTGGTLTVRLQRPRTTTIVYSGGQVVIVDGPNGIAKVVTAPDQVDNDGIYKAQGWFATGAGLYPSDLLVFTVDRSIALP